MNNLADWLLRAPKPLLTVTDDHFEGFISTGISTIYCGNILASYAENTQINRVSYYIGTINNEISSFNIYVFPNSDESGATCIARKVIVNGDNETLNFVANIISVSQLTSADSMMVPIMISSILHSHKMIVAYNEGLTLKIRTIDWYASSSYYGFDYDDYVNIHSGKYYVNKAESSNYQFTPVNIVYQLNSKMFNFTFNSLMNEVDRRLSLLYKDVKELSDKVDAYIGNDALSVFVSR